MSETISPALTTKSALVSEKIPNISTSAASSPAIATTPNVVSPDPAAEKRLLRKLDLHVVPVIAILYMIAFIDRANLGNAKIQGLEKDLRMKGHDYNIAAFVFFIPYILCEVPSNLLLRKFRPSTWLSALMMCWGECEKSLSMVIQTDRPLGIATIGQGVTKSFWGLAICRVLLGFFEAGFLPGKSRCVCNAVLDVYFCQAVFTFCRCTIAGSNCNAASVCSIH